MKIANTPISVILVILFCASAAAAKTKLLSVRDSGSISSSKPLRSDGICALMVKKQGYACEEHTVTTRDGYILSIQRIQVGRSASTAGSRIVVLVQHGCNNMVDTAPRALALLLADNGFDVWLVSSRGTKYSSGHITLSPNDKAYWQWTWNELVAYDLPATVQYVHDKTRKKMHYVGHSLGTLVALAAFSKHQLLNMVRSAALLSPVAYVGHPASPLTISAAENFLAEWCSRNNVFGLIDSNCLPSVFLNLVSQECGSSTTSHFVKPIQKFLKIHCKNPDVDCTNFLSLVTGQNCCLNKKFLDAFLWHEPQPSVMKNMIHLSQMVREKTITMFDHGNGDENRKHYWQSNPAAYNMKHIPKDFPLFLSHGGEDALADIKDGTYCLMTSKIMTKISLRFIS